jgi:hypothetical protein
LVFDEPVGYEICPICNWEDDISQLRFPRLEGGANRVSLWEAQQNYARYGVSDLRFREQVRSPAPADRQDPGWRMLDEARGEIEDPVSGVDYGPSYPDDPTTLYYWRPTFWRREAAT